MHSTINSKTIACTNYLTMNALSAKCHTLEE